MEKALGATAKSGRSAISGVIGPGERAERKGLLFCATPAGDFVCGTLQLAAGMNLHVFTTGRGTPYGLAMAPVVKVSTRTELAQRWPDLIDVDAGRIASGRSTVEEQFLTKTLAEAVNAKVYMVSRIGPGDGLLLSADRNPNIRGALVNGLVSTLPVSNDQEFPDWKTQAKGTTKPTVTGGLNALSKEINSGAIKIVLSVGEDLIPAGLTAAIYTKSENRAAALLEKLPVGSAYVNCCDRVSPRLPWTGRKHSGIGSTLSTLGIQAFVQPKAWHIRRG